MIEVPATFLAMPRWWSDEHGGRWLRDLPGLVDAACEQWGLVLDGAAMHGSNALVVPVRRSGEPLVLRLAPPGDDVAAEVRALRTWAGRGVVRLIEADVDAGLTLLERLDATRTMAGEPLPQAVEELAAATRRLAVPVDRDVRSTAWIARECADGFEAEWRSLDGPTPRPLLAVAVEAAEALAAEPVPDTAADGDLHFEQVLAGGREPWTVVDPVLLRGHPEYDLGRILWSRLDEVPTDEGVTDLFDRFVRVAGVPEQRAARWVVVRSMSYLLWGLGRGLTLDPPRCRRLLDLFA